MESPTTEQQQTQNQVRVDQIRMIITQTNYTQEEAQDKLMLFHYDPIAVIHDYLGIKPKKQVVKSVKQEMFRQFRKQLDIQAYRDKHPVDLNQVIHDFADNDERQQARG